MAHTALSPSVLNTVKSGQTGQLKTQLADVHFDAAEPRVYRPEYSAEATELIRTAIDAHRVDTLTWLIEERFPDWKPHLQSHMAAVHAGPDVYEVMLSKWPDLLGMDLGHNGNPLGFSVFTGNKAMVEYLLAKGVDPNEAHYSGRLVCDYGTASDISADQELKLNQTPVYLKRVSEDIIDILIAHGFTVPEGYQRAGKRWKFWSK